MFSILFITLFTFSIGYLFLGLYVLHKDKHSPINLRFFLGCISSFVWAIGFAFMYISPNVNTANYWRLLAALGWCSFYGVCIDFCISVCYKKLAANKIIKVIIYIPSFIFYLYFSTYDPNKVILPIYSGWYDLYPKNIIGYLYTIYSLIVMITCMYMLYRWGKNSKYIRYKKQSRAFFFPAMSVFVLGSITDTVLPLFGYIIYPFSILLLSILLSGVWYAITRYKMMAISPEYMSDFIFKSVSNPIFLTDEYLNIIKANNAALKLIGYTDQEINNMSAKSLIKGRDADFSSLYEHGSINNVEIALNAKNKDDVACIFSGTVIYDEFKDIIGIIIILQDISDRKKVERMLQSYNNELEEKIKERTLELEAANSAKSEILANVSHELRTPLNVIHSAAQLFSIYLKDDTIYNKENATRHLRAIKQNCLRLIRLVNNVLDSTKIDAKHLEIYVENYDIVDVVSRIVASITEYTSQRGIILSFITEIDTKVIAFDINAIERIILNLISNAIKFTKKNGHITVSISEKTGFIILSIKDDGIGIPEDLHNAIFERFKQVNNLLTRQHEGSGLGLAITKTLVEMHNGKIYVKSEKGNGSEFIIEMPSSVIESSTKNVNLDNSNQNLIDRVKVEFSDIYD